MGAVTLRSRLGVDRLIVSIWRQPARGHSSRDLAATKAARVRPKWVADVGMPTQPEPALPGREFVANPGDDRGLRRIQPVKRDSHVGPESPCRGRVGGDKVCPARNPIATSLGVAYAFASSRPPAVSRSVPTSCLWVHAVAAHRMPHMLVEGCELAQSGSLSELASERICS